MAGWFWLQRDPTRTPPKDREAILSPADGKVLLVEQAAMPVGVAAPAWRIAIYLSLLDVHVQRTPVAGHVFHSERRFGGYRPAYELQAANNAGHLLGIESAHGAVWVIRSAGIIARRVTTSVHDGDQLVAGQRIGRILLGSRVELYLPATVELCVKPGERVRAGESILARWSS